MAAGNRARSEDELIYPINQVQDEIFDLRVAIEYDEAFMHNSALIVNPLEHGLNQLSTAVKAEEHEPGQGEYMDFLRPLKNTDQYALPFGPVAKLIAATHNEGYQEQDA